MRVSPVFGVSCWIFTCLYFLFEPFFISTSTVPYDFLLQPMSDLGVTTCGEYTYALAAYSICSPYSLIVNAAFILTGISMGIGILYLHQWLPENNFNIPILLLLLLLPFGNIISGLVPADVSLFWHSVFVVISMFTVFPAMHYYGKKLPYGQLWTYFCLVLALTILLLLFIAVFYPLPIGLLQRGFYGTLFVWGTVLSILLTRKAEMP